MEKVMENIESIAMEKDHKVTHHTQLFRQRFQCFC